MIKNILLLLVPIFLFLSCGKDESIQNSLVGEWDFNNYYSYYYCSECPEPKEKIINETDVSNTATIYKKLALKDDGQVILILNYPKYGVNQEEHRGNYLIKNDSIFFNIDEVYFDGVKQTISNFIYVDPELKNTLPFDYLDNKSLNFKFSLQNNKLDIFQNNKLDLHNFPEGDHTLKDKNEKIERVTYQRK